MMHYFQTSGIFGALAILSGFFIALVGILILLLSTSRRAHLISLMSAGLPVLIGAVGTLIGYFNSRGGIYQVPVAPTPELVHEWHRELVSPVIVGAAMALPLFILFGTLLVLRTRNPREKEAR